jgi:hypothetical protein
VQIKRTTMQRLGCSLIAYVIADARRCWRPHRALCAGAFAMQESVFLVHGIQAEVGRLLDRLERQMDLKEDDLWADPIGEPASLWLAGPPTIRPTPTQPYVAIRTPHSCARPQHPDRF